MGEQVTSTSFRELEGTTFDCTADDDFCQNKAFIVPDSYFAKDKSWEGDAYCATHDPRKVQTA